MAPLRVALVHDWLLSMRGAERALEALLGLFPRAEIFTLLYDPRAVSEPINRRPIHCSPLDRLPGAHRYRPWLLPMMPGVIERLGLGRGLDLVLSTSRCVAHGVKAPEGVPHATYCFSPMRYLHEQRRDSSRDGLGAKARLLGAAERGLRRWDRRAARRSPAYWATSRFVAERVEHCYGFAPGVIYPPVRTDFFAPASRSASGPYLVVSALTPMERVDLAIAAADALGRELVVVGRGPCERELARQAGPTVRFEGWVDDTRLAELYRSCEALLVPGQSGCGIAPLEAMACGKPVLALKRGVALETHVAGVTGEFFDSPEVDCLAGAWDGFDPGSYDPAAIRRHAEKFGVARFGDEFALELVEFLEGGGT